MTKTRLTHRKIETDNEGQSYRQTETDKQREKVRQKSNATTKQWYENLTNSRIQKNIEAGD